MPNYDLAMGLCLLAIGGLFSFALTPRFAERFYPEKPSFNRRLAAPLIFVALGIICLVGYTLAIMAIICAFWALTMTTKRFRAYRYFFLSSINRQIDN
jgi:hypothetical protein